MDINIIVLAILIILCTSLFSYVGYAQGYLKGLSDCKKLYDEFIEELEELFERTVDEI